MPFVTKGVLRHRVGVEEYGKPVIMRWVVGWLSFELYGQIDQAIIGNEDVDEVWPTADGTIFRICLLVSTRRIDERFVLLAAVGTKIGDGCQVLH